MKRVISASGAITYVLLSGLIITFLLLAVVDLGQDKLEDGARAQVYASMPTF